MKNLFCILSCLLVLNILSALVIELPNLEMELVDSGNYSRLKTAEDTEYPFQPGTPAIPLIKFFFEVPADSKINELTVIPQEISRIKLNKQLLPVQQIVPLLSAYSNEFTEADPAIYQSQKFPQDPVFNFNEGYCGDRTIGYASLFSATYYPEEQTLEIPGSYYVEIEFTPAVTRNPLPSSKVSDKVAFQLGLDGFYRNNTTDSYLLITTEQFLPTYQELLNWRRNQGVEVFWITREEIETQYVGRDLQEKIRNCITDYYENYQISFVTLGGDVDHIPDRKVFAFDCEFGGYEDENDIPSDMYYSCLQGNWDANNNNIFGEDADEIDFFPEVYVARMPVNTIPEIEDYTTRLISYESGEIENYNKAAGFSMQLWPGSNSEICQQYIYDMYFPDYYDIQFFYGEENNQQNAYEIMNSNQNFIQHTGHAGRLSMGLESGRIGLSDIDSLHNEWGGLFYSIGCWSAAIDYNSIGENLVFQTGRGFLGFVGNSRYGWGAPSASGFGFSEFFQKAFFRDLFTGNTRLAEINALQKLDYIPYYSGTSVYKWVAYELNALGDAYLNLSIFNPAEMYYSFYQNDDDYHIIVSDSYGPLENVIISGNEISALTDNTGEVIIPSDASDTELVLFKSGYKTIFLELPVITDDFLIELTGLPDNLNFMQGETFSIDVELTNSSADDEQIQIVFEYNPDEISLDCSAQPDFIAAGSTIEFPNLNISINPISASYQMLNGKKIYLNIRVLSASNNYLLTERQLAFSVVAPDIVIEQFNLDAELISPGSAVPMQMSLVNSGSGEVFGLEIQFSSPSQFLNFYDDSINLDNYLAPGEGLTLINEINIENSAPADLQTEILITIHTNSQEQTYTFEKTLFFAAGQISFTEHFDAVDMWQLEPEWQLVSSEYYSAEFALSCRPQFIGNYWATSPLLNFLPGMELNFQYKYKMPMYGNDGVYVILETENITDTLLFLGAGGALPADTRTPQTYIASDWAEYRLSLDEIMLEVPDPGTQFAIKFLFTVPQIYDDFNEYYDMDEIGVFLDDLKIGQPQQEPDTPLDGKLLIYPNPSRNSRLPRFSVNSRAGYPVKMKIYDIKGRLIKQMQYQGLGDGRIHLYWDGRDAQNRAAAAGMYIILVDTGIKKYRDKFIYFN